MNQISNAENQFKEITRTCMLRFLSLTQNTPNFTPTHNELDNCFIRLLHNNYEIKEQIIKEICRIDLKNDSIFACILTYLQELIIWSCRQQIYKQGQVCQTLIKSDTEQCIFTLSLKLLTYDKAHYSLNLKRCQLLGTLLKMPYCLRNIEAYQKVYKQYENIRQFYPNTVKDQQKKLFIKSLEQSLITASQKGHINILQYIHDKICRQIYELDLSPQVIVSKFRVIKVILKNLKEYHKKILNNSAFLLIRHSDKITENYSFFTVTLAIYNQIMEKLIQKPSIVPLCLYQHLIINNLIKLQRKNGQLLLRQFLLAEISQIFQVRYLKYFLKHYDWNFMEEDICLNSLKILYEYTQDHSNQKKQDYDLYKKYLTLIQKQIQSFVYKVLDDSQNIEEGKYLRKQMKQFYDLKAKQYRNIVDKINNKPKDIFKMLDKIQDQSARDDYIQKVLKILKKSRHIQPKSMINILSAGTPSSDLMMNRYMETFISACKGKNLQQFIRLFTSNFFLWGQAQQVQRVIDKLTVFYCLNQPKDQLVFKHSDVAYTLASAIIILNTDIHNPKNENKMSLQAFNKICKKINQGEDLPQKMIQQIYSNIKHDEILTFRQCSKMQRISLHNWNFIAEDTQSVPLSYYDIDMAQLSQNEFYSYAFQLLSNLIDEKQTAKLELMVERFEYSEQKFDCEIIDKVRQLVNSKPHIAMHVLQKIYEQARFQSRIIDDKLISYYWLASQIIENFHENLPYSKICQFLLITWRIGFQFRDTLKMIEQRQFKSFRKMLREYKKRESKKSIMDMFSKFLSNKDSDQQDQSVTSPSNIVKKKVSYINCSKNIVDILMKTSQSKTRAAQFILMNLKQQQSKRYEQFLSCLFLFFYLLKDCDSQESQEVLISFFQQILNFQECKLGQRIENLKIKSPQKHQFLEQYCLYWALKILLRVEGKIDINSRNFNKKKSIIGYAGMFLIKFNKEQLQNLLSLISLNAQQGQKYLNQMDIYEELKKIIKILEMECKFIKNELSSPAMNKSSSKQSSQQEKNQPKINQKSSQKQENREIDSQEKTTQLLPRNEVSQQEVQIDKNKSNQHKETTFQTNNKQIHAASVVIQ